TIFEKIRNFFNPYIGIPGWNAESTFRYIDMGSNMRHKKDVSAWTGDGLGSNEGKKGIGFPGPTRKDPPSTQTQTL
ncbi:MAG: hypothetical protein ACLFUT_12735, partial [Desulfobacteraceae bacterium]